MLGRLIQTATNYGKNSTALESATEEAHTRTLLYGYSQYNFTYLQSPPTSPYAVSSFRPGTFDDRGGLELEEKDLRIIIAQDAHGAEEKPTILFDSAAPQSPSQTTSSHGRHTSQSGQRSALPGEWKPDTTTNQAGLHREPSSRNRSSTTSGAPNSWTRASREASTREEALLECMFGVTSSTKSTNTTKMHLMPGKQVTGSTTTVRSTMSFDPGDQQGRRVPLVRSRTSYAGSRAHFASLPTLDTDSSSHEAVLVTRLFNVAVPDTIGSTAKSAQTLVTSVSQESRPATDHATPVTLPDPKKQKLIERKVPAFAIGLVIHLPHGSDFRPPTRPGSRSTYSYALTSAPSSYESERNLPPFLHAMPDSLPTTKSLADELNRRIEIIANSWDVVLRALSSLEKEATSAIFEQLMLALVQIVGPPQKVPKEKSMQRINQRIVSITDPAAIARRQSLHLASRRSIRRICHALCIPRVVTGLGFALGHWSDEARMLYRICGRRHQNFLLFNLLTAFLGSHTQWIQRLAPDHYRKQFRANSRKQPQGQLLAQRTVIVSDQRALARRLIFTLASFLPGLGGQDGLSKIGEENGYMSMPALSPSSHPHRTESLRRRANRRLRDSRLQSSSADKTLSSSVSSTESYIMPSQPTPRYLMRKDSDALSVRASTALTAHTHDLTSRKPTHGSSSTMTPNPATPIAYFSTKKDSYFPDGVVADGNESIASADLIKILRRDSSSAGNLSNVSSRWGSLMSGISDLWTNRQGDGSSVTQYSPQAASSGKRAVGFSPPRQANSPNTLRDMVDELDPTKSTHEVDNERDISMHDDNQNFSRPPISPLHLIVDEKDGVVDVDLDLPGFCTLQLGDGLSSPSKQSHRSSAASINEGAESSRSLRSIPTLSPKAPPPDETNVAGYLRQFHEDFALQAVRPYAQLEDDVKRSMLLEESPNLPSFEEVDTLPATKWLTVCTTLVAELRTFTVRKISLKRKFELATDVAENTVSPEDVRSTNGRQTAARKLSWRQIDEKFVEEDVKDFDTTLADAVERVLNLTEALQPTPSENMGHSRSASAGSTVPSVANVAPSLRVSREFVRQDCRQVIIAALEEVVKDVNEAASRCYAGRYIGNAQISRALPGAGELKQENILREGVKRWLVDVEQTKLW